MAIHCLLRWGCFKDYHGYVMFVLWDQYLLHSTDIRTIWKIYCILLAVNNLSGPIPTELGLLTAMTSLDFCKYRDFSSSPCCDLGCHCSFAGSSYIICSLCWYFLYFFLSDANNNVYGTIPTELGRLTALKFLYLRKCYVCFKIYGLKFVYCRYFCWDFASYLFLTNITSFLFCWM